jgi:glycosyltransferase involved in cell wall biosynthesis
MKVALVHDWLVSHRGGERVLDALCELYPQAEIFTLVHKKGSVSERIESRPIHTSFLQRLPGIEKNYRHFLPLMPSAIERLSVEGFDLVLSSSHCVAKGIHKPEGVPHLSYVHAPMRYMWHLFDDYFGPGRASPWVSAAARVARPHLRRWDIQSSRGVDRFLANSRHIAEKVESLYGKPAAVVYPPVDLERFRRLPTEGGGKGHHFLWLGAFAPYKRLDIALDAFRSLPFELWVVGSGQLSSKLGPIPSNVKLLGQAAESDIPKLYADARALIFTGVEDFGMTLVEAQAAGRPVLAFAQGGALESVTADTGLLFHSQTPNALAETVMQFDRWEEKFSPAKARANAERFAKERFLAEFKAQVDAWL